MSWCDILICAVAITILIKILKEQYNNKYGRKR
jgi:hypothetical protein